MILTVAGMRAQFDKEDVGQVGCRGQLWDKWDVMLDMQTCPPLTKQFGKVGCRTKPCTLQRAALGKKCETTKNETILRKLQTGSVIFAENCYTHSDPGGLKIWF